jgi:hypothetical protein
MASIAANVAAIRERIANAAVRAGRDPQEIMLIAASKTKSAAEIEEAVAAGLRDVGENYVQEAEEKHARISSPARWHMIGHLQRNKVARAARVFDVIQTVDSLGMGRALNRQGQARGSPVPILVEVNVAGEASKSGVSPTSVPELVAELRHLSFLSVEGLMTIPPPVSGEAVRPFFRTLRTLRDQLQLKELSMGMSDDFEIAIEEGATMVRIGRAIFGPRPD